MIRLLAIVFSLALSACASASAPPEKNLIVYGDRLFVDAAVEGIPVEALLDSAAEISVADKAWAEETGLETAGSDTAKGTGGSAEVTFAENISVAALGVRLEGLTIAVLDLSDISNRLVGRPVHFIMGRELFDRERLAIDIEEGRIEVISREPTPAGVELKVTNLQGLATVKSRVNGVEADADFDLGNGSGVLIGKAFAEELGLLNELSALERRKGGGVGGEVERAIVRLATLEIAGETFHDFEAAVDETDSAGALNVGVGLLRKFRITTDFSESRLWLDPR